MPERYRQNTHRAHRQTGAVRGALSWTSLSNFDGGTVLGTPNSHLFARPVFLQGQPHRERITMSVLPFLALEVDTRIGD